MKARKIAVLILSLLLVAGIAGLVWLTLPVETPQTETAETVYTVTEIPLNTLYALALQNSQAKMGVVQAEDGLSVVPDDGLTYDQSQLRALLYAACHLTASRKITDETTFAQYGLDAPEATVTLLLTDGTKRQLLLLAQNPVDGNRYLYCDNAVWLVPESIGELFLRSSQDFISHTIFPLRTTDDYTAIDHIDLQFYGNGRDYTVSRTDDGWALTAPFTLRLSTANVNGMLLDELLRLYADHVVASDANLSDYGLDAPDLTISLTFNDQPYTALFAKAADGNLYMANPADQTVYSMDEDTLTALSADYTALLGGVILPFAAGDVSELRVLSGENTGLYTFTGSGESLSITKDGQALTDEQRAALISAMSSLTAAGQLEEGAAVENPALTLSMTLRTGSVETLSFSPVEAAYYAVGVNGVAHFVTTKEKFDALAQAVSGS